ncbi:MAG: AAA family ATPase [Roseburia sp.]|nr:AAA family ATPase [Roseburia sp.]
MKLLADRGAGEAKLFIGPKSKESEIDAFFQFGSDISFRFDKKNMLEYLLQVKMEYVFQNINQYKEANIEKWDELFCVVNEMDESQFFIHLEKFTDSSRYYVRADEDIFKKIFRKMAVPKLTDLIFDKDDENKETILTLKVNYEYEKNEMDVENEDIEERNKRLFRCWMGLQVKPKEDSDAGEPYSSISIEQYISNIANTALLTNPNRSVFYTSDIEEVQSTIKQLEDSERSNTQKSALKKYVDYLLETMMNQESEEVFNHSLYGIHIKERNNALSDENSHVCIGWSLLGDLTSIEDKDALTKLYDEHFEKNNRGRGQDIGQIWRFINDIKVGDYIIFAENSVFHIGRIESEYYFDETEYPDQSPDYKNRRKVRWLKKNISRAVLSSNLHNSLKTAMSIWTLNDYKSAVSDLLRGTYQKDEERIEVEDEIMELVFRTELQSKYKRNRILFGAPGTGKSFTLNQDREELLGKENETDYERVTFHPDYSYANFVGTYKPTMVSYEDDLVLGEDKKRIIAILQDKSKTAQEKYDLLYDEFKDEGLTRLPVLLGIYTDDNFKTRKLDGTDAIGDNSVERNHGRAIRPYVNLSTVNSDNKQIAYEYVPGPFMRVLVKALKSAMSGNAKPHLLIVEEINRANVAAVFGDVFQLLDRDKNGISEYAISTSNDMRAYLAQELGVDESAVETIKIPDNMFIWATMNSADQGVFPMDTAFKRRWDFTYLGIDDAVETFSDKILSRKYALGTGANARLISWNELREAINDVLSSELFNINEDKLLGPYFISKAVLESDDDTDFIDVFKNKVLMYLFDDAVKQKKKTFFEECKGEVKGIRYSDICKLFDVKGVFIFPTEVSKRFGEKPDEPSTEANV